VIFSTREQTSLTMLAIRFDYHRTIPGDKHAHPEKRFNINNMPE